MPVACSTSALTGADGALFYTPAGTKFCLLDFTDFPAGSSITVPAKHDFRVNDPVVFTEEGGSLCNELTAGTQYYVVATTATTISVSDSKGGTAITLTQSGGDTGADTPGGHIGISYDPFGSVCQIQSWDLSIERESLDVTTLACFGSGGSGGGGKYAPFRTMQPGYASGSGTITVIFTDNDDALGQRMLDNVMLNNQDGARVKLVINAEASATPGMLDDDASMFIEADIKLESMSVSVNPDDPVTGEIGYTISNVSHLFKTDLT